TFIFLSICLNFSVIIFSSFKKRILPDFVYILLDFKCLCFFSVIASFAPDFSLFFENESFFKGIFFLGVF
ncbi:MAG: hypothetical protein M1155_00935, partial [Patescibacteria group bacterium]|nr:hypothetical protein [Patescibacteria group bacterium]